MKHKRVLSIILTLCLAAGMLPTAAFATGGTDAGDQAIMWGTSGIANPVAPAADAETELYTYDYIYYGTYEQDNDTNTTGEAIKWRVLDAAHTYKESSDGENKTGVFLLSDIVLDQQVWNSNWEGDQYRDYGTSDIQKWLNGTTSGNFLYDAFSSGEQAGIATTYVETADVAAYDNSKTFKTTPTTDKIFLLSNEEATSDKYGLGTDAGRKSGYSAYAKAEGVYDYAGGACWWLRSPGSHDYEDDAFAAVVYFDGYHYDHGYSVDNDPVGVRPAFNLNLNSVLFTSAAAGGKISTAESGGKLGGEAADAIFSNAAYTQTDTDNGWKVTLLDDTDNDDIDGTDRSKFTASVTDISTTDDSTTLTISYSGAMTGNNEYISAIIKNGNTVESYGRLAQVSSASGTVTLTLPSTFDPATDTLYIFNEQYNGDYMTDYASALKEIEIVSVDTDLTDLTSSNTAAFAKKGEDYTTTLSTKLVASTAKFARPDTVTVSVGGTALAAADYTYESTGENAGKLTIPAAKITGNIKITAVAKKYAVEVTNSDATNQYNFGEQTYGYSSVDARTMTIQNTGNQPLTVTLPANTGDFDVAFSDTSFTGTLAASGSIGINIKPKDGLNAKTEAYKVDNLTISIKGDGSVDFSQSITPTFTVNKADATDAMKTATGETKYGTTGTVDLSAQLAEGCVIGTIGITDNDSVLNGTPSVDKTTKKLSYTFVNDESKVDSKATITIPVTSSTNYNEYSIIVTVEVLSKYAQTISFADTSVSKTYGDAAFTVGANHSVGDGAVTYESSNPDVATVDNSGKVTILKVGTTTITATAAETENYHTASASYTLTVEPKALTVQPKAMTVYVNSAEPTFELAYTGLVGTDSVTPSETPSFTLYESDGTTPISAADAVKTAGTYIIKWENKDATTFSDAENYDITKTETAELKVNTRPSSGGYTPPTVSVTVPISGDENTINVDASVSGDKATIDEVDLSKLDTVIGDDVATGTVTIDFSTLNKELTEVEIPADVVKQIAEAVNNPENDAESLEIVFTDGTSIEFDAIALGEKNAQAGGADITISIQRTTDSKPTSAQQAVIGSRPAYDISVTSGGKHISDMGGHISIHTPYTLKAGEKASGIVVYYVDDNGNRERCETSYDSVKKRVNWKTSHLSVYMIDYDEALANNPFTDVAEGAYYFNAVLWAVNNGVTEGTSATTFGPDAPCTRGQMATFLWRAAGSPDPVGSKNPFTDVAENAYYTTAVQWAVEQGITVGTSATTFSPDAPCTRAQMATFLWRMGGSLNPAGSENPFTDVPAEAYYTNAVQWIYEQKITGGTSATTFSPDATCTRAQMVTFLYRYFVK